ncbi:energy transducer TonB [Natronospira bacteriovora]|uniref:Energy transducer TonB n=1 Tax=Natronospira bacteriovora TaxID=3069753 RepID=A0ABU0W9P0_9GAMM|nr:energy transducer TonB [Natronospira sp. AB-CW4]MDQ2070628.1 energy transducer TonB [Natronospira sp. AB-CW4]
MLLVRLFVCALIASVLVFMMASLGVRWFYDPESQGESTAAFIERVNLTSVMDVPGAEERRRETQRDFVREGPREREAPPPVSVPERQVSGFVQVEYTVFPDGTVENVEVVGAQPSGIYEDRAREQVQARDYTGQVRPTETDGVRRTEVVEFTVPASRLQD